MASQQDEIQFETVAFLGLGVMGYPMASNLRRKLPSSTTLLISDVNEDVLSRFQFEMEDHGPVRIIANGREATEAADIVISVLPSESAVETVYLEPSIGAIASLTSNPPTKPKLLIECGTVSQTIINHVSDKLNPIPNVTFIDAPISGGPLGSKSGTLSFMVGSPGGPSGLFSKLKPLLSLMGKPESIFHCGDVGSGTAFKIINNYIALISVMSVSEAYSIASKMGLDIGTLTNLLGSGSAQCWVVDKNNPVPGITPGGAASNDYKGGFRIELAHKVLSLGKELAEQVGVETVMDKAALGVYEKVMGMDEYKGRDCRVVYKWMNEKEKMD